MGAQGSINHTLHMDITQPLIQDDMLPPASVGSERSVTPPSFKAGKPRKTKDLIGSYRKTSPPPIVPSEVDPRLLQEADTQQISMKVASLIFQHVEEGRAKLQPGPLDDEFHEAHFLRRRCCGIWPPRSSGPCASIEMVFDLINDIATSLYFCKQVIVLCAVYIERLLEHTCVTLTNGNWRSIVVVAVMIASKVWEDVHPWNADFEECLDEVVGIRYEQGALYRLESLFLSKLSWRVFVDGEIYAAYFFALLGGAEPSNSAAPDHPELAPRMKRRYTDTFTIETIMEDEPYISSGNDLDSIVVHGNGIALDLGPDDAAPPPTSPKSPFPVSPLPWSREELVSSWKRGVLGSGEEGDAGLATRAIHDAWKLDARNPYIGALRHAPRALAPSRHIPQSEELLWAHQLAVCSTDMFGPPQGLSPDVSVTTLSGATGAQLASELRQRLGIGKPSGQPAPDPPNLFEELGGHSDAAL